MEDLKMEFLKYLLEEYEEFTEGASHYDGGDPDDNFQDDLSGFFEKFLIYDDDIKKLADQFGADIITAAMRIMACQELQPVKYTDLSSFINLAFSSMEENHYNEFKEIFLKN